ncbi:hypothetical protein ACFU53_37255 [Streptomyces sp. NPDC057474]|uniref:hypothetical protein n=1 Tax=Streptomyces sp. NPDC057474 TaxID=3346144 RepID=UPI0036B67459
MAGRNEAGDHHHHHPAPGQARVTSGAAVEDRVDTAGDLLQRLELCEEAVEAGRRLDGGGDWTSAPPSRSPESVRSPSLPRLVRPASLAYRCCELL